MVAEGYLGASELLCEVEELFATLPGTEEAGGLLTRRRSDGSSGETGGEAGGDDVEGYAEAVAEVLEVGGICLVLDIFYADVQGFDAQQIIADKIREIEAR